MLCQWCRNFTHQLEDSIFYGQLDGVTLSSPGNNYDIINVPQIGVADTSGIGAKLTWSFCDWNLEDIDIIDGGFDYQKLLQ